MVRCVSDSGDRRDLPLTAKCHDQFNPEKPQKDTGKVEIFIAVACFVVIAGAGYLLQKCLRL